MSSWEIKEGEEQISRDIERAEEYQQLTARATVISANKFELSTGLTIAARYADKLRRVAIVALGKIVPRDVIIRDIANLNKILYEELVNKMKIDKLEVVKIVVDVIYDQASNKLNFENIRISRYYSEEKIKSIIKEYEDKINSLEEENKKLKNEINSLQTQLNNIKEVLNKIAQALESVK